MKQVEPSFYVIEPVDKEDLLDNIEKAGRVSYKSEDRITHISAAKFVERRIKDGHESILEHEGLIFRVGIFTWCYTYLHNPKYLFFSCVKFRFLISGNIRALRDFGKRYSYFARFLSYLSRDIPVVFEYFRINYKKRKIVVVEKNELKYREELLKHLRVSVNVICDRGIGNQIVRHRIMSFTQESTRFVNYAKKDSFEFIKPDFLSTDAKLLGYMDERWKQVCCLSERTYILFNQACVKSENSRSVLLLSTKTQIVISCNLDGWVSFFEKRALGYEGTPHPQMLKITKPMLEEFKIRWPIVFNCLVYANLTS